jgi:hypothetical protein
MHPRIAPACPHRYPVRRCVCVCVCVPCAHTSGRMSALLQAVRVRPTTKRGSGGAHTVPLRPHAPWCGAAPLSGLGEGRALTLTGSMKGFDDGGTEYARDTTSVCVRSWYSRAVQHGEAAKLPPFSLSSTVAGAVGVLLAVGSAVATPAAFAEPVVGLVDGATPTPSLFHNTARQLQRG